MVVLQDFHSLTPLAECTALPAILEKPGTLATRDGAQLLGKQNWHRHSLGIAIPSLGRKSRIRDTVTQREAQARHSIGTEILSQMPPTSDTVPQRETQTEHSIVAAKHGQKWPTGDTVSQREAPARWMGAAIHDQTPPIRDTVSQKEAPARNMGVAIHDQTPPTRDTVSQSEVPAKNSIGATVFSQKRRTSNTVSRGKTPARNIGAAIHGQTPPTRDPVSQSEVPVRNSVGATMFSQKRRASHTVSQREVTPRRKSIFLPGRNHAGSKLVRSSSFPVNGFREQRLIKAGYALAKLRKLIPKVREAEAGIEAETDDSGYIRELPTEPRFASTLSAEAQFAIMMGYEDLVYQRLTLTFPEFRSLLRRTKTPNNGVEVTDFRPGNKAGNSKSENEKGASDNRESQKTSEQKTEQESSGKAWASSPASTVMSSSKVTMPILARCRSASLPNLVPADRQRVMTYRYQRAMDIYDQLRRQEGVNVLSPRITKAHFPTPQEFNSWSAVWRREFKPKEVDLCH